MAERFDPSLWHKLENPDRLKELPPSVVVGLLDLQGAETVVDFGAGTGMYTLPIAEALPHGRVLAVEAQADLLQRLRDKLDQPGLEALRQRVRPVLSEPQRVPLPDAAADALFAINVVHHVHDEPAALDEIARLVRPGGRLAIIEFGRMERPVGPPADHVLQHDELRALVASLGFVERAYHEPGELTPYHVLVAADKPAA